MPEYVTLRVRGHCFLINSVHPAKGPQRLSHYNNESTQEMVLLQPHCKIFNYFSHSPHSLLEKVDSDGLLVALGEDAAAVSLDHARLAHRPVPHDHHLQGKEKRTSLILNFG